MGRLFWKFFLAFLLAQVLAALAMTASIALLDDVWGRHGPGPAPFVPAGPFPGEPDPFAPWSPDGPPGPPPGEDGFGPPFHGPPPPPYLPMFGILLGCLAASGLLAWYLAAPVRHLRWALGAVGEGRLETRVAARMGGRHDEIAELGRDFDRMAGELQQLVESQRQLLHDVSHELRSPLARLQVAIGLARQDPAKLEVTFDRIERESGRLATLVGEILTLARLEAGRSDALTERFDLVELVAGVAEDACFEARSLGRELDLIGDLAAFTLVGRAEQLHRAFENVLRNAVKYTAPGTRVEVRLARPIPEILVISVRDHGPGVAPDELERLFQPFFRARQGTGTDGFGLGLAIARRAVQAHLGRIQASLPDGGGLCVEIRLPRA